MDNNTLISTLGIGLILVSIYLINWSNTNIIEINKELKEINYKTSYLDRIKMYETNQSVLEKVKINGLYYFEGYYCVWTKGRENKFSEFDPNLKDITETAMHEYAHHLSYVNKSHFCV